jgi:hypothetical protein
MAASTVVPLSPKSQEAFITYYKGLQDLAGYTREVSRARYEAMDLAYQREVDRTKENAEAIAANRAGDPSKMQNIIVPVVMPQVEAAVVYQTSVFLTGVPIMGVVASPEYMDEAVQLESKLDSDSTRGGWARELMLFFRDGFKYNFAALEVDWGREVSYSVETNVAKSLSEGVQVETIWSGNRVKRLDPYNTFVDTRVPPTEVYKRGEFAGYTQHMSKIELKAYVAALADKIIGNIKPAFESGTGTVGSKSAVAKEFYVPSINPEVDADTYLAATGTDWMSWAGIADESKNKIAYKDSYELTTLYCKILPAEFGLKIPKENTPQIYKLCIVNHEHIIYAELQTNAHNYLPILIGQPTEDGLGYQTKSLAKNAVPFQQVTSAYMTSILASRRRAISDRVLYDPSRVDRAHINSSNPSAKIPVRPHAYGKQISDAVYAFPYRDDQAAGSMQQISALLGIANTLNGQNQAQQGQFVKGNKTLHEYESVMQNANGRDQLASILLEHQIFTPMKAILKLNTLQYVGGTTIYNRDQAKEVEIDPVKLRKAVLNFKVTDGLTPASKIVNGDTLGMAFQAMAGSPQIGAGYNVTQMFSYLMKTQGADLRPFEKSTEQSAYEQAMQSWQGLMQLALEKGADPKAVGPQPNPKDFNYNPQNNKPAPAGQQLPASADTGVIG